MKLTGVADGNLANPTADLFFNCDVAPIGLFGKPPRQTRVSELEAKRKLPNAVAAAVGGAGAGNPASRTPA